MRDRRRVWPIQRLVVMLLLAGSASGCIQVRAPDKPIEINLNIKIRQEIVVLVQKDAQDLIDKNPELFPE
jgi:hypothetical protein